MNNKITIYTLLGLVKDGQAPKRIKYDDRIFEFDELEEQYCYHNEDYSINEDLNCHIDGLKRVILKDKVEILDNEDEEKKIPEKLEEYIYTDSLNYNQCNYMFEKLTNKYNEIIDYLDYLKSKGE